MLYAPGQTMVIEQVMGIGVDQLLSSSLLHGALQEKLWDLAGISTGDIQEKHLRTRVDDIMFMNY